MNRNGTGEPAFPIDLSNTGMTLRDYFAAKAMAAYIDRQMLFSPGCETDAGIQGQFDNTANFAYRMADAMMKARK